VHVPFADAPSEAAHTSQAPPQLVLQQKPSTQLPLVHWTLLVQAFPLASVPVQLLDEQKLPPAHWAPLVQLVWQAAEPLQTYGAHEGLPVLPAASTVQVPLIEAPRATEQTSQAPPHAVLQQKPSTQLPLEHWLAAEHATPWAFLAVQVEPLQ
jgi:hypothetical protein